MLNHPTDFDYGVDSSEEAALIHYRTQQTPMHKRVALARSINIPGKQKLANRSRYSRQSKDAKSFNGAHRRRDKRNGL